MKGKLSIIEQIRLIRDKFPDVCEHIEDNNCPIGFNIGSMEDCECGNGCKYCWDKALEDDK